MNPTRNDVVHAYVGEQLEHSADDGATWQPGQSISPAGSPCTDVVDVLQVDPQNPRRLFTDAGCYAGRDFGFNVSQSFDGGATFSRFFDQGRGFETAPSGTQPVNGYPRFLVGGSGHWYLALDPFMGSGPARLFRSDNDCGHWTQIWYTGDTVAASGGVAFDPNNPEVVYVAVGTTADPNATGVQASQDGWPDMEHVRHPQHRLGA